MNRRLYVRDKSILLSLTGKIFYGQKVVMREMTLPEFRQWGNSSGFFLVLTRVNCIPSQWISQLQ